MTSTVHAAALATPAHAMGGMDHSSAKSVNCATLCTTSVLSKEQDIDDAASDQDLEPTPPAYYAFNPTAETDAGTLKPESTLEWPLLKVPIYLMNQVLRI